MLIDFNKQEPFTLPCMNHGKGTMTAKIYVSNTNGNKIITCSIHPGGFIGLHRHDTSDDINYVISGTGKAFTDGKEEILEAGVCHICPKGSAHRIVNTGEDDLVLLTIVVERKLK